MFIACGILGLLLALNIIFTSENTSGRSSSSSGDELKMMSIFSKSGHQVLNSLIANHLNSNLSEREKSFNENLWLRNLLNKSQSNNHNSHNNNNNQQHQNHNSNLHGIFYRINNESKPHQLDLSKLHQLATAIISKSSLNQSFTSGLLQRFNDNYYNNDKHDIILPPDDDSEDQNEESEIHSSDPNRPKSRVKRQVPCERGEELDDYVDSLFRFASRLIRAMEPFNGLLPNVTIEMPEFNLIIFLHMGGATHAYTIQRKKPAWVLCSNESISLGLTVGFEELRIMYKFRAIQDWKLLFDGEVNAQITHPKVQVQFTQTTPDEDSEEAVQQRIDALRIWSIGPIRIMLKGLGNLTQGLSMFLTGFINRNIDNFMPQIRQLEGQAIIFANNMLQNISIPFFSII